MKQILVILLAGLLCFQIYQKTVNAPSQEDSDNDKQEIIELSEVNPHEPEEEGPPNPDESGELSQKEVEETEGLAQMRTDDPGLEDPPEIDAAETNSENNFNRQTEIQTLLNSLKLSATLLDKHGIEFILVNPKEASNKPDFNGNNEGSDLELPFYLQETEMTQGNWEKIMGGASWKNSKEYQANPGYSESPGHPIYFVSYSDVHAFISQLNSQELTSIYRLPTQEEWEYAAKPGLKPSSTANSEPISGTDAWCSENASEPMPVGTSKPNSLGFRDMVGNVWEWVMDKDDDFSPKTALTNLEDGRIKRGGSWMKALSNCNYSSSDPADINTRDEDLGFRLVRDIPELKKYKSVDE